MIRMSFHVFKNFLLPFYGKIKMCKSASAWLVHRKRLSAGVPVQVRMPVPDNLYFTINGSNIITFVLICAVQAMREVSVDTFLEYVRTNNVEAIEAALRSDYDIDAQDQVSTVLYTVSHNALSGHLSCHYPGVPACTSFCCHDIVPCQILFDKRT